MEKISLLVIIAILLLASCDTNRKNESEPVIQETGIVSTYKKQALPDDFTYKIIEDASNEDLQKNQLTIEINEKITIEQIATLAEKFYSSKPKERRFYIFYLMPGMKNGSGAWATSHFDPGLKIEILGSTAEQDAERDKVSVAVEGDIVGKWHEEQYTSANYIIFKKGKKIFVKTIFGKGATSDAELEAQKVGLGTRYNYKSPEEYHGEYFILNTERNLEFYNRDAQNFTTASRTK